MENMIKSLCLLLFTKTLKDEVTKIDDRLVAAGDPARTLSGIDRDLSMPVEYSAQLKNLEAYKICGSSMSPCGISNGDVVYVEDAPAELRTNDFIVVAVDSKVYQQPIKYKHKLRRYLMNVSKDDTLEQIIEHLKTFHKDILLPEYQQRLQKKFEKTKDYYPDDDLCLSITFCNGSLRYSFHPRRLVEFRVKFVVSVENRTLTAVDEIAAY